MWKTKLPRCDDTDKLTVAAHEAGHLTVALVGASNASARIFRQRDSEPERYRWAGVCRYIPYDRDYNWPIEVAGAVGECLVDDMATDGEEILYLIDSGVFQRTMSITDRQAVPTDPAELFGPTRTALEIIRRHQNFFRWAVDDLVTNQKITGRNAEKMLHRLFRPQLNRQN